MKLGFFSHASHKLGWKAITDIQADQLSRRYTRSSTLSACSVEKLYHNLDSAIRLREHVKLSGKRMAA